MVEVLACHCENCRRLTGNFTGAVRTSTSALGFSSDGTLGWYDLDYAKYGFCRGCGSTLFFVPGDRPHETSVMVGVLDDSSRLVVKEVWFADERQPQNPLLPDIPHFEGNGKP